VKRGEANELNGKRCEQDITPDALVLRSPDELAKLNLFDGKAGISSFC
jgi:hypothetical protein